MASLAHLKGTVKRVVLAYSGGLDTSCILPWLIETYGCEVICYTANVGQEEELSGLEAKAKASGAKKIYIEDLRAEFVRDYVFPTLKAGAVYERQYLLGTSMARPLIAKRLAEIALAEGADAIAHGATGKGNDQVRFEIGVMAFHPHAKIIAPWRLWSIRSRDDALAFADAHGVPSTSFGHSIYSRDRNLWHVSHEGHVLEDPYHEPEEPMFLLSVAPEKAPETPQYVEITFKEGIPTTVDGQELDPVTLLETLNKYGGANGVGRLDMVENRLVGIKSRGVYETPGGTILVAAIRGLEQLCLDRETQAFKDHISDRYARMLYDGLWFTPLREAMDAFINVSMKNVTGKVRVKLFKGSCVVVGRTSPFTLYSEEFATFGKDDVYNQSLADGFIKLFGLPVKIQALNREYREKVARGELPPSSLNGMFEK